MFTLVFIQFETVKLFVTVGMEVDQNTVTVSFFGEDGSSLGPSSLILPFNSTTADLQQLCNQFLELEDDPLTMQFRSTEGVEILESLEKSLSPEDIDQEKVCSSNKHLFYFF